MTIVSLEKGFTLEKPPITVPWGLTESELVSLLEPHGLQCTSSGCFLLSCTSLNGLPHRLGIRFDQVYREKKYCLSFMPREGQQLPQTYHQLQRHLEATFGPPTVTEPGEEGFPSHQWALGEFTVMHSVHERFVLCQHASISPRYYPPTPWTQIFDTVKRLPLLPSLGCLGMTIVNILAIIHVLRRLK